MPTQHRISAGALVIHDNRVLLVKTRGPGQADFWVPPGGGAEGNESLMDCAVRECIEECGLRVRPTRIVYIEEFFDNSRRICKHWILCDLLGGEITFQNNTGEERDHLVEARFSTQAEVATLNVFPRLMRGLFWTDLANGFPHVRHLAFVC